MMTKEKNNHPDMCETCSLKTTNGNPTRGETSHGLAKCYGIDECLQRHWDQGLGKPEELL